MTMGNRGPGTPKIRRRWAFRPNSEGLEGRQLLAVIDVSNIQIAPSATVPAPAPEGVALIGKANNNLAGYTVTDVGDVTGSGFDSFIVAAPGLAPNSPGGTPTFGTGESAAYLVFGSKLVDSNNAADFLTTLTPGNPSPPTGGLTSGTRAGDLGQLGTLGTTPAISQINPTVKQPLAGATPSVTPGFNFDGLTLVTGYDAATGLGRGSGLGFSVAALGDINGDGFTDFAISAPNDTGGGRAFVIFGGRNLTQQPTTAIGKTIDLEPTAGATSAVTPTKVVSLSMANAAATTEVGYSVAGIGNFFNSNIGRDIGIGIPGLNNNTGAAFAISGTYVSNLAPGQNVDLTTLVSGTNAGVGGIEYTGFDAGGRVGAAISSAGTFDGGASGTTNTNLPIDSLLIGAPGESRAYLVYGSQTTLTNSQQGTTQSLSTLGVPAVLTPTATTPLQGVIFQGRTGDQFGYSVGAAGDFDGDGVGDVIIGAPLNNAAAGYAQIFYGVAGTVPTTPTGPTNRLGGNILVTSAAGQGQAMFTGTNPGDFAGFSIAASSHINFGTTNTAGAETTTPGTGTTTTSATQPRIDLLVGSPGFGSGTGAAYLIPGTVSSATTGSGTVPGNRLTGTFSLGMVATAPFNGTQFSVVNPNNDPAITVAGLGTSVSARNPLLLPSTTLTTLDGDSVPDIFLGAPYSSFNNPSGSTTTTTSRTLNGVVFAIEGALIGGQGTTTNPTTPTTPGGGGGSFARTTPTAAEFLASPIFTGLNAGLPFPPVGSLEHLQSYKPLPVQIALEQYLPAQGFRAREEVYHHPGRGDAHQAPRGTFLGVSAIHNSSPPVLRVHTLSQHVFDRGKFKHGQTITFTHKGRVIPRSEQTERLTSG